MDDMKYTRHGVIPSSLYDVATPPARGPQIVER
jgi:hypothetical protein